MLIKLNFNIWPTLSDIKGLTVSKEFGKFRFKFNGVADKKFISDLMKLFKKHGIDLELNN